MIKYNSDHIIVGQIKQMLSTFNLPKYRVYTKENQEYHDWAVEYNIKHSQESGFIAVPEEKNIIGTYERYTKAGIDVNDIWYAPYIKDGELQYYVKTADEPNAKWAWEIPSILVSEKNNKKQFEYHHTYFQYDVPNLNQTKTLKVKSNIYDSYTHEYLGDYLRFKRDYNQINLMSMYNCFSNRLCPRLNMNFYITTILESGGQTITEKVNFNTANTSFKIYMVPVKLFQKYTIAIDSNFPIEICCNIYGKAQEEREKFEKLPELTYKKYSFLKFNNPVIYDYLTDLTKWEESGSLIDLAQNEQDLKMFIKLPANNESSIVILEGDYRNYNDTLWEMSTNKLINKTIINYNEKDGQDFKHFKPISSLQLLRMNTKVQHPFADRLIEYLTGNVITSEEEIIDNIRRAQTVISNNNSHILKDIDIWDPRMNPILYDFMMQDKDAITFNTNHDLLGFVDKDTEKYYKDKHNSILGIDLYTKNGLYDEEDK